MDRYFLLNSECYLVRGASRGAVYDLLSGQIYSIDATSSQILVLCQKQVGLEEICQTVNAVSRGEVLAFLRQVQEMGLGAFFDEPHFVEQLRPQVSKAQRHRQGIPPVLAHFQLELYPECNLRCTFCNNRSRVITRQKGCLGCNVWQDHRHSDQLDMSTWERVLQQAIYLKCYTVQVMGGEPLLDGDRLRQLIEKARIPGYRQIILNTNGTLLDPDWARFLVAHEVHPLIQIFSAREEIHDRITGVAGSFAQTIRALECLRSEGGDFSLALVLVEENRSMADETKEFFNSYEPTRIYPTWIYPDGTQNDNELNEQLNPDLYIYSGEFAPVPSESFFQRREGHPCWEGKLAVTWRGDILPCIMAREQVIGNARHETLAKFFEDSRIQPYWDMSMDEIDECQSCEFRYACFDCRPFVASASGQFKGKNPYCLYEPSRGEWSSLSCWDRGLATPLGVAKQQVVSHSSRIRPEQVNPAIPENRGGEM